MIEDEELRTNQIDYSLELAIDGLREAKKKKQGEDFDVEYIMWLEYPRKLLNNLSEGSIKDNLMEDLEEFDEYCQKARDVEDITFDEIETGIELGISVKNNILFDRLDID